MYKKVVVPLDGSNLAEQALLYLDEVAADCPEIHLVSVTAKVTGKVPKDEIFERFVSEHESEQTPAPPNFVVWQPSVVYADVELAPPYNPTTAKVTLGKMAETAEEYLERIAEKLAKKGFSVTTNVIIGDPAKEIVYYAKEQKADLILMASTGGRPGLSRWNMEHIAEKVMETTKIPIMLVKPAPGFKETKPKRHGRTNSITGGN